MATSTNRVSARPLFYGKVGMVVSSVNMTLSYVGNSGNLAAVPQLESVGGLLYGLTNANSHYKEHGSNNQQNLLGRNGKGQLKQGKTHAQVEPDTQEGKNRRSRRYNYFSTLFFLLKKYFFF